MKNRQNIAIAVSLITVFILFGYQNLSEEIKSMFPENSEETLATIAVNGYSYILPSPLAQEAWSVFENYLEAAKNHDIEKLAKYSYKLSPVCLDENLILECYTLMDNVYALGTEYEAKDFNQIYSDDKQIIMTTDYDTIRESNSKLRVKIRGVLYFIRESGDIPKLIGFSPTDGVVIREDNLEEHEIQERIRQLLEDSDGDSIPDATELCEVPGEVFSQCEQTNPFNKDTNGNGYWDSIDLLIRARQ